MLSSISNHFSFKNSPNTQAGMIVVEENRGVQKQVFRRHVQSGFGQALAVQVQGGTGQGSDKVFHASRRLILDEIKRAHFVKETRVINSLFFLFLFVHWLRVIIAVLIDVSVIDLFPLFFAVLLNHAGVNMLKIIMLWHLLPLHSIGRFLYKKPPCLQQFPSECFYYLSLSLMAFSLV